MPSDLELAALAALRRYVKAAVDLQTEWLKLGRFDILTDHAPEGLVDLGEQIVDLIGWRDRVAEALGWPRSEDDPVSPPGVALIAVEVAVRGAAYEVQLDPTDPDATDADVSPDISADGDLWWEVVSAAQQKAVAEGLAAPSLLTECRCCGNREQDTLKVSEDPSTKKKYLVCLRCDTAREWPDSE